MTKNAKPPQRASNGSAGYDLCSAVNELIPPGEHALISTGLKLSLPVNTYGRVAPRSGLSLKHSLDIMAGVIDRDFRGIVQILIRNFSTVPYTVTAGQRVAQLICERIVTPPCQEVEFLSDTDRCEGGFGSTGY